MRDDRALAAMPPRKYSSMALRQNDDFSTTHGATQRFTSFRFPYVKNAGTNTIHIFSKKKWDSVNASVCKRNCNQWQCEIKSCNSRRLDLKLLADWFHANRQEPTPSPLFLAQQHPPLRAKDMPLTRCETILLLLRS